jgi:hypothetical protein
MDKFFAIGISAFFLATTANAGTEYYYTPQAVGGISGKAFSGQNVEKTMMFQLSSVQDVLPTGPISSAVTNWNVGDFSGSATPAPFTNYQRGLSGYGGTSVAMFDQVQSNGSIEPVFSSMLNGWDFPYNKDLPLSGSYLTYWFSENGQDMDQRPFRNGPSSTLYYSSSIQVPTAYVESGGQSQLAMGLTFVDRITGMYFWFMPAVFITTPSYVVKEDTVVDPGTNAYMLGTYIGAGSSYLTPSVGSSTSTSSTWTGWRWYGYSISNTQMQAAINKINNEISKKCQIPSCPLFSTDPANYRIGTMFTGSEVTRPELGNPGRRALIGFSSRGQWLYSTY